MASLLMDEDDEDFIWKYSEHRKRISFLPRRCRVSGESLWFKRAWRCTFYDWGGEEYMWFSEQSYLWKKLKDG